MYNFQWFPGFQSIVNYKFTSMGQTQVTHCTDCQLIKKCVSCPKCQKMFCQLCLSYPLIHKSKQNTAKQFQVTNLCKKCFEANLKLDLSTSYTVICQQKQSGPQIIFLHGGGGTRAMFTAHARILAKQKGYRSILIDLPGHGSLANEELTLDSCLQTVIAAKKKLCKQQKVYLVGGSFGGYVGMQVLGTYPEHFKAAAIMMCGQNVGQGRGKMASFGLWAMQKGTSMVSQATSIKQMIKISAGNKNLDMQILEELFECGMFFKKSKQQIAVLKSTNSQKALKLAQAPILFMNGQKDHRDSEEKWLKAAPKGSKLKVFKDTDHFFSHDKRYFREVIEQIASFFQSNQ